MEGQPLAEAKEGAKAFLATLDPRDQVSLVFFSSTVYRPIGPYQVGTSRAELEQRIDGTVVEGGTALYDAVAASQAEMMKRAKANPHRIHAVVVMTDGADTDSKLDLDGLLQQLTVEGERSVTVFTIGYGPSANADVLGRMAERSRGTFSRGSVDDIRQVYRDIATFF
jgi:Ca-activated chloride channel family protein